MALADKTSRGFTLIELLISMSLLSLLIFTASAAFGVFTQRWEGRLGHFQQKAAESLDWQRLFQALQFIYPYYAQVEGQDTFAPIFDGTVDRLRAISARPVFNPAAPALIEIGLSQQGPPYTLEYREWPLTEPLLFLKQTMPTPPFVLSMPSPLLQMTWRYYGWENISQKALAGFLKEGGGRSGPIPRPRWWDHYQGVTTRLHPFYAELNISTIDGRSESYSFKLAVEDITKFSNSAEQ